MARKKQARDYYQINMAAADGGYRWEIRNPRGLLVANGWRHGTQAEVEAHLAKTVDRIGKEIGFGSKCWHDVPGIKPTTPLDQI